MKKKQPSGRDAVNMLCHKSKGLKIQVQRGDFPIRRSLLLVVVFIILSANTFSQTIWQSVKFIDTVRGPIETVQAYVDAANRHDLNAFLALYAPNIKKYKFPLLVASEGIEHMRKIYEKSFAEKSNIKIQVRSMIALGDKVVSEDHVTGLPNGDEADEITVYQVEKGLITNIVYIDRIITSKPIDTEKNQRQ